MRSGIACLLLLPALFGAAATGEEGEAAPGLQRPALGAHPLRMRFILKHPETEFLLPDPALSPAAAGRSDASISLLRRQAPRLDALFIPRVRELSRFDCALKGAGAGMQMGLFLGALAGELRGTGNDPVDWYLMGACAATGALLGGTVGAETSSWNVRCEWSP
ncbi:MAG: hypothetical protein ABIH26_13920 [Candidatus Eisenbacteria bacterium]